MQMALAKVMFLPYAYILDKWRWEVYRGHITPDEYNARWWYYRYNNIKQMVENKLESWFIFIFPINVYPVPCYAHLRFWLVPLLSYNLIVSIF